jgi:hypothetical protein
MHVVKNTRTASLWSPRALRSGAGSRRKGLGFSLCAAPSRKAVLVFQSWAELSRDGVQAELRTKVKGFEDQRRRWVGVRVGVGEVAKMSKLCKECRELDQVIDSIFELKIIHAREVAYM